MGRAAAGGEAMVDLLLRGQRVEGQPLLTTARQVVLLGRDGHVWDFAPGEASDLRVSPHPFRSYPVSELRAALLRELGQGYDVSSTHHYVIAHPQGQRDQWSQRFEDLYRALVHYFIVRGFTPREPEFPLIGVVCRNRQDFDRRREAEGVATGRGVLGYYAHASNRILLYDVGSGHASAADWRQNASVVIHEATHQTAFNTGLHNRFCAPPTWLAEGLAMMFEAPGVYDSQTHLRQADRINRGRLQNFRQLVQPQHNPAKLEDLVAGDQWFKSDTAGAYAEAWALTFFLVETQPRKYADYLARTAKRPSFTVYSAAQRKADFAAVFGGDYRLLEARFLRFIKELPAGS